MSLLDSLLLDDYRINFWIAARTDGIKGSGTIGDPYDGSTAAKFDALMRDIAAQTTATVGVRVNLGPGIFQTVGYYDGIDPSAGWRPSARMKIVGSGIDVTTLKLVSTASANSQAFAVGHVLGNNTAQVDFFEISDLTIDCDLEHQTHDIAAGAIRIKGNHSRIRRIKAVNWGTRTTSKACYVIASIAADAGATIPGIFDTVIDECIAVEPDSSSLSDGIIAVLHIGDRGETAGLPDFPEPTGESAVIRNCFVDCGQTDLAGDTQDIRALSVSWCHGVIVEGNQIHNVRTGGPHQARVSVSAAIVRNNIYRNVVYGPYFALGILSSSYLPNNSTNNSISFSFDTGAHVATATTTGAHWLRPGDRIWIWIIAECASFPGNKLFVLCGSPVA